MKVYVCGKMTGLPEYNYPKFIEVAENLRQKGFTVYNPVDAQVDLETIHEVDNFMFNRLTGEKPVEEARFEWEDYMKASLKMMLECDIVYVLDGYEDSRGANVEIQLAKQLGMYIVTESGRVLNDVEIYFKGVEKL